MHLTMGARAVIEEATGNLFIFKYFSFLNYFILFLLFNFEF